jgi:predicted RNA-binding protein with PIN domain
VSSRLWILDGHNIIFALGELKHLQTSERGEEARSLLVERLQEFAHRRGERVLVVFDGGRAARGGGRDGRGSADLHRKPLFEVVYSGGAGGADRRILDEARGRADKGAPVTVVTDDVATLAIALPRQVRHLGVREFWLAHIEVPAAEDEEKPVVGRFPDIERALLALEPASPAPRRETRAITAPARPLSGEALRSEELRRKRERGRLRHERLLKRRSRT